MNRLITLTHERLERARTPKGGYTAKQLKLLGIGWPAPKGWKKRLTGQKIVLGRFIEFVRAGKNMEYLAEINNALPHLVPPIFIAPVQIEQRPGKADSDVSKPSYRKLPKKEIRNIQREAKQTHRRTKRAQRVIDFGYHAAVKILLQQSNRPLTPRNIKELTEMLMVEECDISIDMAFRIYNLLKQYGYVISATAKGNLICRSHNAVSENRRKQLLYIIRAKGTQYCKIGVSKNPRLRLSELQTSNPNPLFLAVVYDTVKEAVRLEKSLHKTFSQKRCKGEWFKNLTDEDIDNAIGDRATCLSKEILR
jgi:hypothetical protein